MSVPNPLRFQIVRSIAEHSNLATLEMVRGSLPRSFVYTENELRCELVSLEEEEFSHRIGEGHSLTERGVQWLHDYEFWLRSKANLQRSLSGRSHLFALEDTNRDEELDTLFVGLRVTDPHLLQMFSARVEGSGVSSALSSSSDRESAGSSGSLSSGAVADADVNDLEKGHEETIIARLGSELVDRLIDALSGLGSDRGSL